MMYKNDTAKKKKCRMLALDLIISIIPILYVLVMLIIMFTCDDTALACYLIYGGIAMGVIWIASLVFRIIDEIYVFKLVDKCADVDVKDKQAEGNDNTQTSVEAQSIKDSSAD